MCISIYYVNISWSWFAPNKINSWWFYFFQWGAIKLLQKRKVRRDDTIKGAPVKTQMHKNNVAMWWKQGASVCFLLPWSFQPPRCSRSFGGQAANSSTFINTPTFPPHSHTWKHFHNMPVFFFGFHIVCFSALLFMHKLIKTGGWMDNAPKLFEAEIGFAAFSYSLLALLYMGIQIYLL